MNSRSRWLAVLALVAIFLAGGVTGWLVRPAGRSHGAPRGDDLAAHLRTRLTRELSLTPQQVEKAAPIIAETAADLDKMRRESEERVGKAMDDMHTKLSVLLTPEQIEKLAALREKRKAMRQGPPGK